MNNNLALIYRLNRAQGQIEALKRSLQSEDEIDCNQMLQQVKAVSQAMKKFAEAYVAQHMIDCLQQDLAKHDIEKKFVSIMASAFNF